MITTQSQDLRYLVRFSNGSQQTVADVLPVKGGQGAGFGPHELLEASLACCINMWVRMQADQLCIPVGEIAATVTLHRDRPDEVLYEYTISIGGEISDEQ